MLEHHSTATCALQPSAAETSNKPFSDLTMLDWLDRIEMGSEAIHNRPIRRTTLHLHNHFYRQSGTTTTAYFTLNTLQPLKEKGIPAANNPHPGPAGERLTLTPRTLNSARARLILEDAVCRSFPLAMTLTSRES